jgi:NAD(P)H-hydrate epimerase
MQEFDRSAIKRLGIPGVVLMENAGSGAVAVIEKRFGPLAGRSFTVFSGKGNNGGDGFVVSRHLLSCGANVLVALVGRKADLQRDSRTNYNALLKLSREHRRVARTGVLQVKELRSIRALRLLPRSEFVVDALFGTGFSGSVRGFSRRVIEWINSSRGTNVSLDLPSGIDADNGEIGNIAVKAQLTVTMGLKKIGLLTGDGRSYAGSIEVANIGVPPGCLTTPGIRTFLLGPEDVRRALPVRAFNAHKHSVGKVVVLAGSRGMTGAAAMASASALRSGAGAVVLGTPASVYPVLARKLTEVMVEPLPETSEGSLSMAAGKAMQEHLDWADVLIIGPGLSRNEETRRLVREIIAGFRKRILVDADGLNALAGKLSVLKRGGKRELILTPHTGELARLTGLSAGEIERNRVQVARKAAKRFGVTLVLKGAPTVTVSGKGDLFVNSTGNPGMATAGSGDVLSGIIGALWAQGLGSAEAAYSGVYLHGRAGDLAGAMVGEKGLMAMDIYDNLPRAFLGIEGR